MEQTIFFDTIKRDAELINRDISRYFEGEDETLLNTLIDSEKYSLTAGGKRIRPIIAFAFCRLFGGMAEDALSYALALEMIHTASLIHDDLPCIDNDDLRRGKPTNHKVFGEATALLAADGLIIDAFGVIAKCKTLPAKTNALAVLALSEATGTHGMVGGEFIDVMGETTDMSLPALLTMNAYKTGALIKASAILGALAAGVSLEDEKMKDAITYAESIGLCFQIIDDILDVTGNAETLGKNPGQDEKEHKTTYLSFHSISEAEEHADILTQRAIAAVSKYDGGEFLAELAKYLLKRDR